MDNNGVFVWGGEADAYYTRNATALAAYEPFADPVFQVLQDNLKLPPETILDLGCASGERLSALCRHFGCDGVGIDASSEAIRAAEKRDPETSWWKSPIEDAPFFANIDVVICSMVLHWLRRDCLLGVVAYIDELLSTSPAPYLLINDFYPEKPQKNEYRHRPGQEVWTFKRRYQNLFVSSGLYDIVAHRVYPYHGTVEVAAVTLLQRKSDI